MSMYEELEDYVSAGGYISNDEDEPDSKHKALGLHTTKFSDTRLPKSTLSKQAKENEAALKAANSAWTAAEYSHATTMVNKFGKGNAVVMTAFPDERVDMVDVGRYKGRHLGQIKKRLRWGLLEQNEEREREEARANGSLDDEDDDAGKETRKQRSGARDDDPRRLTKHITDFPFPFPREATETDTRSETYSKRSNAKRSAKRHAKGKRATRSRGGNSVGASTLGEQSTQLESECGSLRDEEPLFDIENVEALQPLQDVDFPLSGELSEEEKQIMEIISKACAEEKRIVIVTLDELVAFNDEAIATRVFGGVIQAIQLMPALRLAAVTFVYPAEANAFITHIHTVRSFGTTQERRALQLQAQWYSYNAAADFAILPLPANILSHIAGSGATRALQLSHLPATTTKRSLVAKLAAVLGADILILLTVVHPPVPPLVHRSATIEFASLSDAITAKHLLERAKKGYKAEYTNERSEKLPKVMEYCGCMGCRDGREQEKRVREEKIEKLRSERSAGSVASSVATGSGKGGPGGMVVRLKQGGRGAEEEEEDYKGNEEYAEGSAY